jgi:phage portal protein BeeE
MNIVQWFKGLGRQKALATNTRYGINIVNGTIISPADNRTTYLTEGYAKNPMIYSIVTHVAEKVRIAPWALYKVVDESSLKIANRILATKDASAKDYVKAMLLRQKSLVETTDDKITPLLKRPNPDQTFGELVVESTIFKMCCGGRMVYFQILDAGANMGKPQYLWVMPYDQVNIVANVKEWPMRALGYKVDGLFNIAKTFTPAEVMHDKYPNPIQDSTGGHLYGQSPLKPALDLITKSNSSIKAATAQFQNGGPKMALFVDDERASLQETGQLANDIKNKMQGKEYTGPENNGKILASAHKLGVVQIGSTLADLNLVESDIADFRMFCNIFGGLPSQVFNDPNNKTYNNTKEGEKAATSRGVIPHLNSFRDAFNGHIEAHCGYDINKTRLDYGIECYPELQEDLKDKWEYISKLPISWRSKLEMMEIDADENIEGLDEVMIPSGFVPIDSLNVVDDELNGEDADSGMARGDR